MKVLRTIVEGEQSLLLREVEGRLELVLGNVVLLSSGALETELVFGRLAKEALAETPSTEHVVIGGLGFGATLRGVLEASPSSAKVVVVEKLATVVDVARGEAAHLVAGALEDERVEVRQADVADVITEAPAESLSAILLDVDNGPGWASFRSNARLYSEAALARARTALAPGGMLAVWSGYPADAFLRVLRKAGFVPRIEPLYERGSVRARAYIGVRPR